MTKVFIDGSVGTTGLRIRERLEERDDVELIILAEEVRKDNNAIAEAFKQADIAFLCLPDAAAIEAVELAKGSGCKIIDTSTAHRTNDAWAYGFPELSGLREKIENSDYIANPGCHASGFIALTEPLVKAGLLKKDAELTCISLTGYSGGGKKMIAQYDAKEDVLLEAPRQYGLTQNHKHLPEMKKIAGMDHDPVFCPIVSDFYSGMEVTVPVFKKDLNGTIEDIKNCYQNYYTGKLVHFEESADDAGFISASKMSGRDDMVVTVAGNEERVLLIALFDNLGKGASGAAIQNMNILMHTDETKGLVLQEVSE